MTTKERCPACATPLARAPKRLTKCPACGRGIHVSRKGVELLGRALVTEDELRVLRTLERIAKTGLRIAPAAFRAEFDRRGKAADTLWAVWQGAVMADPINAPHQYSLMAAFVNAEGRDPAYLLRLRHRAEMGRMKRYADESGLPVHVEVLSSGNGCAACEAHNGTVYPLDVAMRDMPLPLASCTHIIPPGVHPHCRCIYSFEVSAETA